MPVFAPEDSPIYCKGDEEDDSELDWLLLVESLSAKASAVLFSETTPPGIWAKS